MDKRSRGNMALEKRQSIVRDARIIGCGAGETALVLSHGYGADQSIWDKIVPEMARRFRVVLFDWDFSGAVDRSPLIQDASEYSHHSLYEAFAEDLISLIDEMNLRGVVFVGHSMAGMIGCLAAVRRPELFRRLVPLGASPRYLNAEGYEGGFELSDVESIFTNIESNFKSWAGSFARIVVGESYADAAEKFGKSLVRMRPEVALAVAKAVFLSDLRDVLDRVKVPCTVISGVSDPVVPVSVAHYMQSKIGGKVTLEILNFDGHFPQLTACRRLVDILGSISCS